MCKESRERCHLLRLQWANITPKNTEVLPFGTCSHSDQECQCQCARPAKYIIWIELHYDIESVISSYLVRLRSVLVLSNNNSIPCVVVRKQQMSENLLWLRRHMKQAGNPPPLPPLTPQSCNQWTCLQPFCGSHTFFASCDLLSWSRCALLALS